MRAIRNQPIQRKLTIITMVISGTALFLASLTVAGYEVFSFRTLLVDNLRTTAAMVAENSASAIAFEDPDSAEKTLRALSAEPDITSAAIYDAAGKTFASYPNSGVPEAPPPVEPEGHRFTGERLVLFHQIKLAGDPAGTVMLESSLEPLWKRLRQYAAIDLLIMLLACGAAFLLSRRLTTAVSGPISHLAEIVHLVAKHRDYTVRARKGSEDELGQLMDGFNGMLDQIQKQNRALEEARDTLEQRVTERTAKLREEVAEREQAQTELESIHRKLVTASRQAGMAEVATNVLHNVGNVLNSVNVSAGLISESIQKSKVGTLAKVVAMLKEHEHDLGNFITADAKGKHIPAYFAQFSDHLLAEQAATLKELESLRSNIDHIKEIVSMQQSYAKVSGVKEIINVTDLIEDSLRMNVGALSRHGVEIVREFEDVPPVNVDKHKVLQILINLVRNAKYACSESARPDKRVTVRVEKGEASAQIKIIDNGVGIPQENMDRIFNHGFTTRDSGHGFGLHHGALAANELGGSLSAHSDGPGKGATFTLELPLCQPILAS